MLSLSYDEWANTSPPPPLPDQPDLILSDRHQQHRLSHDLSAYSSVHHHHPTIFPDPFYFSTLCTFPHHNPPPLPYIETLSGYPEDLNQVGLNLGGQTYYFFGDHDPVTGFRVVGEPRCQVDGCNADLSLAKNYHRRHKVCELHSKAAAVFTAGSTQRFCQQCSRFHVLSEFDKEKRSCRKRLANHNRRRRKLARLPHFDHRSSSYESEDAHNSPSIPM